MGVWRPAQAISLVSYYTLCSVREFALAVLYTAIIVVYSG